MHAWIVPIVVRYYSFKTILGRISLWKNVLNIKIYSLYTIIITVWFNMYCALYCVLCYEELYWRPIRPLSYRHSSGVVRNPHSTLAEWGIFNLRSMSPQGTHLLIVRRRNSTTSVLVSISWKACLSATCEPQTINLSITGERITFTM